ncbi:T-cell immunoglobulin and mucin domain-containing protein 4 isoform X2 [Choloepus didactylus]|uniref:T-cell immunoglobulin and mucin domain-containing protein 4 isoform X2 n=1 Tax=Choloepus didactylus TaxID=27675 RepID=UPI00189D0058|nr:T-cell immunoglobulin and mucin domain-containing protein 4 isoform X2 [Choloepus didactylus]
MSKGPLFLWLVIELGLLYLTATSEIIVQAFLGQSVTLPCLYTSWSPDSNSMCWGKGQCPNSKCNEPLLHTDGRKVTSRKSSRYRLRGNIEKGDVSLTISDTHEADSTVYCCRIEVPGWFNDVKRKIHLQLMEAPLTTQQMTTPHPATTTGMTTTTAALITAVATTQLTIRTSLQTRATAALTTTATTCPQIAPSSFPEAATVLLATQPSIEGPIPTTESVTSLLPSDSETSAEETSRDMVLPSSKESKVWVLQSKSPASMGKMSGSVTFPQPGVSETAILAQNEVALEQVTTSNYSDLLMIIAPSVGFVLLMLLVGFVLRGKVTKTNCLQKHTRLDDFAERKNVLNGIQHGMEEDGLFTL